MTGNEPPVWLSNWTIEPISRTAVHESGATVRVTRSDNRALQDTLSIERLAKAAEDGWFVEEIILQAEMLLKEGRL